MTKDVNKIPQHILDNLSNEIRKDRIKSRVITVVLVVIFIGFVINPT
ncbi:MAG: hypothetical protein GQ557_02280 [Mycoplasmataceae bacterium]|nr:hypothetical protein [Mycoplasmataceae bacterium]